MGRFQQAAAEDAAEEKVDISPLIDVVFILLIFFIVATTFVEERGLTAEKPEPAPPSESEDDDTLTFRLTENGNVMHEGRTVGLAGVQPLVRNMTTTEDQPVIIQVEDAAPHALIIRVMDESRIAGAERITLNNAP